MKLKSIHKIILLVLVCLLIGGGAGYFFGSKHEQSIFNQKINSIRPLRDSTTSYKFINPLLLYIIPSADQEWGLSSMKNQISTIISDEKNNGLSDASLFFQDLNRGKWMGIDQNNQYDPGSMLKVVIMVSYYKEAEDNPTILNRFLIYTSDLENLVSKDPYNDSSNLVVGKEYTVDDLIKKMIVDSDNGAAYLLLNNISQSSLDSVYNALNIQNPDNTKGNYTISPRYYSFFFRILYSSTYLSESYSEKALAILSSATFKDGIVAGLPNDVTVAHKYGEHIAHNGDQVQQVELHDCGIVYYPKNPYLLCIMTRGNDVNGLKDAIKKISSAVYESYSKNQ